MHAGGRPGGIHRESVGLPYLIARVEHVLDLRANRVLAGLGLSVRQMGALDVIAHSPGISSVHLARQVLVTRQTMNAMVVELVARDAVARTAAETGRTFGLSITETGQDLLRQAAALLGPLEAELFGDLTPDATRQLRDSLWAVFDRATDAPAARS